MRSVIGFVAGVAAGVAGVAYLGTESGRQLRERLVGQASPEIRSALEDWEPTFQEVAKAARQGMKELEAAAQSLRQYIDEQAAAGRGGEGIAEDVASAAQDVADAAGESAGGVAEAAGEFAGGVAEAAEDGVDNLKTD